MRTTTAVEDEPLAAAKPADPPPAKRGRAKTKAQVQPAVAPGPAALAEAPSIDVTAVRMLSLDEGLYALRVGRIDGSPGAVSGMTLPMAHVSAPFAEDGNGVEIVASFPRRGPWIEQDGGTVIVRSPIGGGYVVVTVYGQPGEDATAPALDLRRLDRGEEVAPPAAAASATARGGSEAGSVAEPREIPTEILLHIERAGDRLFPGRGWVGALGRKLRMEA